LFIDQSGYRLRRLLYFITNVHFMVCVRLLPKPMRRHVDSGTKRQTMPRRGRGMEHNRYPIHMRGADDVFDQSLRR